MTVDVRSLVKLEAFATAFRMVVTVAAGLLALAILANVTETFALTSAILLLLVALAGPIVHGWLAVILRDGREWALEATLIATAVLWLLDGGTALAMHLQDAIEPAWTYVTVLVLVSIIHLIVLVQAGRLYADQRAQETTEPEAEGDLEAS